MKYIALLLLTYQFSFSQNLILLDTLGKNTDTLQIGNKIKMRFYSDKKLKIGQFLRWDGDSTTYFFQTKILAIDSLKIVVKHRKDSLSIPISKIYEIRKIYSSNLIISQVSVKAPIAVGTALIAPFLSLVTLGGFVTSELIYIGIDPIIFPMRKFRNKRYSLVYLKDSN